MEAQPTGPPRRPVPWRTIFATVAVVVGTLAAILVVRELHKIIGWLMIAAMAFHLAALAGFVGHLRLIHEFDFLVERLRVEGMAQFPDW